jgi:glycosyltransferase involved in cell wall biosynthesis
MMPNVIHAITPGDHFSPRTGSAISTDVHGIAGAAAEDEPSRRVRHRVLLDESTFHPRYDTAGAIEYRSGGPLPTRAERMLDAGRAALGRPRTAADRALRPLAAALRDEEPSVVLAHNLPFLPPLLRGQPHRVVLYAHNELLRTVGRPEARRLLDPVSAVVCVSRHLADSYAAQLPAGLRDRVFAVHNGVDPHQFHPAMPGSEERRRLRVMFVGRVIHDKGADVLLSAARRLGRDDVEVVIVGSSGFARDAPLTAYERTLRRLAAAVPHAVFEPFVDRARLPGLLRTADVFVAPSRWPEPFGNTVAEALATGLPVIASRVGGIPEVTEDAAILVPPDDPDALAAAIAGLADDPALRQSLGAAARGRAGRLTWQHSWRGLRQVLESV